jgi:GT2 family glycosyltransferase/intein/homing endonuclease
MLKVYWIGYGGSSSLAEELRPVITELGMELVTIHEWPTADIKWERNTWLGHLRKADIIICPANYKIQPAKSANRVTQALSLGKPVIASPMDAYLKVLKKHPGSFLIADTQEEWKQQLQALRDSEQLRTDLSKKAIITSQDYSIDVITDKWLDVFKVNERVDIVIPTYKNLRGLKLCLDSIKACTDFPYNIIVVNNGTSKEMHEYLNQRADIQYTKRPRMNFAQGMNAGITSGSAKYVLLMNDDVVVSKGWLSRMVEACTDGVGAVGPLSNCDKGWRHNYDINVGGVDLLPGTNTFEQIEPIIPQIYEYQSPHRDILEREWVAFYATLIPRSVITRVGLLNEDYTNSGEDVDLCRRIKKCGYRIVDTHRAFVWHMGAVSRKLLEKEDIGSYQTADKKTNQLLGHLWGKESIAIYSGPSWEKWSYRNVNEGGIGGSETWVVWVSRELSKLGYRVTVFADCPEFTGPDGDVEWLHYGQYPKWVDQHWTDYFISSRTTDSLKFPVRARKIYVLSHDIWLLSPKNQLFIDRVDKFCALSEWHKKFMMEYHGIPEEKMALTFNGIDFDRFSGINVERNPYRLIYSSSADRGLDTLLYLFDFIKTEIPELELHVFYGFENWMKSIKINGKDWEQKKLDEIQKGLKKPGIFYHGRVGQKELAIEFMKSSLWAQPTDFEETFCCLPGSMISTNSGQRKIENVMVGDKVFTHKNRLKPVTKLFKRKIDENICNIKVTGLKDRLFVTGNHPILSIKRENIFCWKKYGTVCTKRGNRCNYADVINSGVCKNFNRPYSPTWNNADILKKGDFVLYPKNIKKTKPGNFSEYLPPFYDFYNGLIFRRDRPSTIKKSAIKDFIVNEEFLEVCGWYVAEGCSGRSVHFSLGDDEKHESLYMKKVLESLGRHVKIYDIPEESSKHVTISSLTLSEFFSHNFGKTARDKKIPQWIKNLDTNYLKYFIRGLINGDGSYSTRNRMVFASSSEQLVIDLFDVLVKIGYIPSMTNYKNRNIINVRKNGKHTIVQGKDRILPMVRLECLTNQNKNASISSFLGIELKESRGRFRFLEDDRYVYLQISELKKEPYLGFVYNFSVDQDNSYVVNNVIVHNCITAIECQRAGVPVLASNYAGLQTTVGDSGILIGDGTKGQSYTKEYRERFVAEAVSLLKDRAKWQEWSDKGFKNSEKYSWANVAKMWDGLFKSK